MKNIIVAITLLTFSTSPLAVAAPPSMGQGQTMGEHGMMSRMCPMMAMSHRTEGVLALLKVELDIKSSQAQAWADFAEAYRDAKSREDRMHASGDMMEHGEARPLPDRMARHVKMIERHLVALKELQGPTAELYAALDADQKKTADELIPTFLMCRMM